MKSLIEELQEQHAQFVEDRSAMESTIASQQVQLADMAGKRRQELEVHTGAKTALYTDRCTALYTDRCIGLSTDRCTYRCTALYTDRCADRGTGLSTDLHCPLYWLALALPIVYMFVFQLAKRYVCFVS